MTRSKSKVRPKPLASTEISKSDLKRFAGSSDEEDDDDEQVLENWQDPSSGDESPAKDEDSERINSHEESENNDDDDDDELEPDVFIQSSSAKMSNAMAKILGTSNKDRQVASVVLSKTTTPLQRMQMKQKEEAKALREKRRDNRERSLTALHIPLSVATTNTINTGQHSVAKELEQERLHRRVATRGVVALFNAITQHQQAAESSQAVSKSKDEPKLTKHSFLSKIKSAASATDTEGKGPGVNDTGSTKSSKWNALNEDYLLNHKKNWDEESSDEDNNSFREESELDPEPSTEVKSRKKRRKS